MSDSRVILKTDRIECRLALGFFCLALSCHFWGATAGWTSLNLPGCEFRQTQTAISALFIQREQNFSLAYPTPVLGKPWAIPMEFPLYQWTVVVVSDGLNIPLTQAGRAVSLACFYLSLPAFYLLLAHVGLARSRRLLVLGFIVTCPLYIFYARAFLIETMATLFGAWFLLGYVRAVEMRSKGWLLLAALGGVGCGVVKVTTLFFFMMPALLWTFWWFWQDWKFPTKERWPMLGRRVLWCALVVVLPCAASIWWVHYSDAIKAQSAAGNFLLSDRLTDYNFGIGQRFSPGLWRQHGQILFRDLTSVPALVLAGLIALIFARRWWWLIGLLLFLFFVVQLIFPVLYAWHEYYYVASAFTLMMVFGLAVCGMFESRLPRVVVWLSAFALYALQIGGYLSEFYPGQKQISSGGSNLTLALRTVTAPDEVLVIAGEDWNSMTPYFAARRALMIRRSLEHTWTEIEPAFDRLKGEDVTVLVLYGEQAKNQTLIDLAVNRFQLDPKPVFKWRDATVLLHREIRAEARERLRNVPEIEFLDSPPHEKGFFFAGEFEVGALLQRHQSVFDRMSPRPFKFYSIYGISQFEHEGKMVLNAHPDVRLWFQTTLGRHTVSLEAGISAGAYDAKLAYGDQSDGIEIRFEEETNDGDRELLFTRIINPRDVESQRGLQQIEEEIELKHAGVVVLTVGPGKQGSYARDWAMIGRLEIK